MSSEKQKKSIYPAKTSIELLIDDLESFNLYRSVYLQINFNLMIFFLLPLARHLFLFLSRSFFSRLGLHTIIHFKCSFNVLYFRSRHYGFC
jgi:hypothetical protein